MLSGVLPIYRTIRGTSSVEAYHAKYRRMFYVCVSPKLAHTMLMMYNYKWNISRMAAHRHLIKRFSCGFLHHYLIDAIQIVTQGLYDTTLHPSWTNTFRYRDNGENFGLRTGESETNEDHLTTAVRKGTETTTKCITTVTPVGKTSKYEHDFFMSHCTRYIEGKFGSEAVLSSTAMALFWNSTVSDQEKAMAAAPGTFDVTKKLYRKTAALLQSYYSGFVQNMNREDTMVGTRGTTELRKRLRQPVPISSKTLAAKFPQEDRPTPKAARASIKLTGVKRRRNGAQKPFGSRSKKPRAPQVCQKCGHLKHALLPQHVNKTCTPTAEQKRPENAKVLDKKKGVTRWTSNCTCTTCTKMLNPP